MEGYHARGELGLPALGSLNPDGLGNLVSPMIGSQEQTSACSRRSIDDGLSDCLF